MSGSVSTDRKHHRFSELWVVSGMTLPFGVGEALRRSQA
jgi:hypothetical protein